MTVINGANGEGRPHDHLSGEEEAEEIPIERALGHEVRYEWRLPTAGDGLEGETLNNNGGEHDGQR